MRSPRPFQIQQFTSVRDAFNRGLRHVIVEAPTGTGKAVSIAMMAKMTKERGGKVLILVNRDILVTQLLEELKSVDVFAQREQSLERANLTCDVVVASIQSLQGKWLERWPKNQFRLVILDEAHGSAAPTFKKILDYFLTNGSYSCHFTATPERHDKKGLWKGVQDIVFSMTLKEAIDEGWLCGFDFYDLDCPVVLDDKLLKKATFGENEEVFDSAKYLPRLAECAAEHCQGRKGLFFLPNCRQSQGFSDLLKERGLDARHVDSSYMSPAETTERLQWFASTKEGILCNAQLLTTGYNNPSIDLLGMFRPFASTPAYKQALGRGTRPIANIDSFNTAEDRRKAIADSLKPNCKVITPFWENGTHNLASPSVLITDDEEERAALDKKRKPGKQIDLALMESQLKASREMKDKDEEMRKLAEKVANSQAKKQRGKLYIADILKNYNPSHKPASDAFVRYVRKLGADIPPGQYSAYQIMRIKERILKQIEP